MLKRYRVALVALLAVCGFTLCAADSEIEQLKKMIQEQNAKIAKLEQAQSSAAATASVDKAVGSKGVGYLAPDKPAIRGTGLSFTGEYLYWTANKQSADYVTRGIDGGAAGEFDYIVGGPSSVELGWSSGFRLGLGYQLPYDGWSVNAAYTYFRVENTDTTIDTNGLLNPTLINQYEDPEYQEYAEAKNKLSLDIIDFEIGRRTEVSQSVSIRPFFGFRYVSIDDSIHAQYSDTYNDPFADYYYRAELESETDLYGIRLGSDVDLKMKHGFSLYGQASGSLLSGSIDSRWFDAAYNDDRTLNTGFDDSHTSKNVVVPAVQIAAGVSWERKVLDNLNLKVSLGYEYNMFFGAINHIKDYVDDNTGLYQRPDPMNVGFHGLAFRIHLDF